MSNSRESTIANILKPAASASAASASASASAYAVPAYAAIQNTTYRAYTSVANSITPERGSYFLNVLFYLFMYLFLLFLIAILVHFRVTPIFKFMSGDKGIVLISGNTTDLVYWNTKVQPPPSSIVPVIGDRLAGNQFIKNFSFCIDLFVRRITDSNPNTRLILYKSSIPKTNQPPLKPPTTTSMDDFISYMSQNSSMIMYLTNTNDLALTFFSGIGSTNYSCPYIKNVPLYTPFRISVVVEDKLFSLYLNGKQTFQRVIPGTLEVNGASAASAGNQVFFSGPVWANQPSQTVFVQNFHIWPRAITYAEVLNAQPALALQSDFSLPPEPSNGQSTC
jgi:hypothetical protein